MHYPPTSRQFVAQPGKRCFSGSNLYNCKAEKRYIYDGDGKRVLTVIGENRTVYIGDYFEASIGASATTISPPILPAPPNQLCHDTNDCYRLSFPPISNDSSLTLGTPTGNLGTTHYLTNPATPNAAVTWKTYYFTEGDSMKAPKFLTILLLAFLIISVSCTLKDSPPKLESRSPHIRGKIMKIFFTNNRVSGLFVEASIESDTKYEKAMVAINDKTMIYTKTDNKYKKSEIRSLAEGAQIEVLFSGPIKTSAPIQATAEEIVILK